MLRNLTFVVQIAFFSIRPKLVFVFLSNFWATFVNAKSNFWVTFWEITGHFLENLEQLVESLTPRHKGLSICLLHKWGLGNTRARETSEKHERGMMGTSILFLPFLPRFLGSGSPNRVPRVLSYPPCGAREGWVGENPGNEVAGPRDIPASLDNNRSTHTLQSRSPLKPSNTVLLYQGNRYVLP